jgi:hypothetical protein
MSRGAGGLNEVRKKTSTRAPKKKEVKSRSETLQPARPSFIISEEGEVVKGDDEIWREDLTRSPLNPYCKGCELLGRCVINKIAAVALCNKKST